MGSINLEMWIDHHYLWGIEIDSLSPEELRAAKQMYQLCYQFINEWEDQNEIDSDDPDRFKTEESEREY